MVGYRRREESLAKYGETGVAEPLLRKTPSLSINQPGSGGFPARWQSHSYALWVCPDSLAPGTGQLGEAFFTAIPVTTFI